MSIGHKVSSFLAILAIIIGNVLSEHHMSIIHRPKYVLFDQAAGSISSQDIPNIISLAMGFQSENEVSWKGLLSGDVFKRPKANVLFSIHGVTNKVDSLPGTLQYPIKQESSYLDTDIISNHIQSTFIDARPLIVDMSSGNNIFTIQEKYPDIFSKVPGTLSKLEKILRNEGSILHSVEAGTVNASEKADLTLLAELQLIDEVIKQLALDTGRVQDSTPDFYSFGILGYQEMVTLYGANSQKCKDAMRLITDTIKKFSAEFQKLYNNDVMIEVVTLPSIDKTIVRKSRKLMAEADKKTKSFASQINLADQYSDNFATVFNIIFWLSLVLIIALYAISYGIWNMDPGRDSIIYRMTTQRLKSD